MRALSACSSFARSSSSPALCIFLHLGHWCWRCSWLRERLSWKWNPKFLRLQNVFCLFLFREMLVECYDCLWYFSKNFHALLFCESNLYGCLGFSFFSLINIHIRLTVGFSLQFRLSLGLELNVSSLACFSWWIWHNRKVRSERRENFLRESVFGIATTILKDISLLD